MITILAFIFVLGIAILFHELGHFIIAKMAGIKVFTFSIGFGPKIVGISWRGTEYKLCLLPFGGYVKMAGEEPQGEVECRDRNPEISQEVPKSQRFDNKPFLTKSAVVMSGPLMNVVLAILLLMIVFSFSGIATITNTITEVASGKPAALSGLQQGDRIIAINSLKIDNAEEISQIIDSNRGNPMSLTILRNNETTEITIIPEYNEEYDRAMIGITLEISVEKLSFFQSFKKSLHTTGEIIQLIIKGFLEMFTGKIPVELAGPLGIAQMAGEAAQFGFINLLFFTSVINIFLGVMNLLPIPILDGGQVLLFTIENIRNKPFSPEYIKILYLVGLSLIVMVFLFATYQDILRIFIR
ncbi:MAG: RIP metalloprotease RseP [Candidatus Atribacteria bacterium]|nr:RIP metalloprotease RseP [Candidatus Atribacteria bacterium]